jgi:hypothetical protein
MIICSWNRYITAGADKIFIPEQVIATGIAESWEEETDEIVPQVIKAIHAASRIITAKIKNYF